jgi:hypothetical protein
MHNSNGNGTPGAKRNYDVGYKKPPRHGQFKPGQSGNPKGRPKKAPSLSDHAKNILSEKIAMREGDLTKRITMREALLRTTLKAALNGDHRARQVYFLLIQQSEHEERVKAGNEEQLAELQELDQIILDEFQAHLGKEEPEDGN